MAFPFSWNPTSPNAATDKVSQFPSMTFYHGDKTTLKDILPLTDLASPSTATLGWRTRQIGNVIWMTANALWTGVQWDRDDTTKTAHAIIYEPESDRIRIMHADAGANPITWTEYAKFTGGSIEVAFKAVAQVFEGKTVTLTSDVKALSLIPTWNNAGVTFTGISLDVTDTASAANSLLAALKVGGATKFSVDKTGIVDASAAIRVGTNPASAGVVRLPNAVLINWRNAANSADYGISLDSSNNFAFSLPSGANIYASPAGQCDFGAAANRFRSVYLTETVNVSGTLTTDIKTLLLTPTWNNSGVTFTGISFNVTDTASASGSLLMNLQAGGVSKFSVRKDGKTTQAAASTATQFEALGGTVTTDQPVFVGSQTWNASAVTFTGLSLNVTDTASAAGSLLAALKVGGVTRFSVRKDGLISTASTALVTNLNADAVDGLHKTDFSTKKRSAILVVPGNPAAGAGLSIRLIMPVAGTITAIKSTCRVAPTATYTYDINKNGTTIYTTQANRPTRTSADGTGAKTHTAPDVTTFAAGDIFEIDLDVAGTGISDVAFFIEFSETGQ